MRKIIFLDAGHGGRDPGAVLGNRRKSDDSLRFALAVQPHLVRQGFDVRLTRCEDVFIDISTRWRTANECGADLFVSLHRNAAPNNPNGSQNIAAHGIENWVRLNAPAASRELAADILTELADVGIQANRGIKSTGSFGVLNNTKMPATLVELGFVANAEDNRLFDTKLDEYAQAIAKGICITLGAEYLTPKSVVEIRSNELWRVQLGAFRQRENAERLRDLLHKNGFEAFIVAPLEEQSAVTSSLP